MRELKYELKRLPDVEGKMNWILSRITKDDMPMFISWDSAYIEWDRAYIEKETAQLKVGESKIIEAVYKNENH